MDNLSQELRPIGRLLIEVSPIDLSSVDCVEKLQTVLCECQRKLQVHRDDENVLQLLKYGLEKLLIESLQAFSDQSDAVDESNESLFDVVLETINVLAECGVKACELIVPNISTELLEMLTLKVFTFQQKMEVLKSVNILLEYSTFIIKERLLLKQSFIDILKRLFSQILYIGDYEFQVGAIECLFRLIPKKVRDMMGQTIISDPRHLATFLLIQDGNFETDCRTFLNNLNSSLGDRKRVMSIPCISVQLGSRPLQKPSDNGYNEFWVDFNYGSQRITVFCEQDSTLLASQQTQDDDLWETISILHSDVQSFSFTESNHCITAIFELSADVTQIFSQMRNIEGNQLVIVAEQAYNMPLAVTKTFNPNSMKKVSAVCEPVVVKSSYNPKSSGDVEMVPSSQMSVASSVMSGTPRKQKVSIPYIPMSTPASMCMDDQFSKDTSRDVTPRIQTVKDSVALADLKSAPSKANKDFQSPALPTKPIGNKKRVKTPIVVLEPDKKERRNKASCPVKPSRQNDYSNKENIPPEDLEDTVIPDSLPSQTVPIIPLQTKSNHKLREVDSGICLVEQDQLLDNDENEGIRNKKGSKVSTTISKKNVIPQKSQSKLMTVSEASKLCLESDDNISDLSSSVCSNQDENQTNNIPEDVPVTKNTSALSSNLSKRETKKPLIKTVAEHSEIKVTKNSKNQSKSKINERKPAPVLLDDDDDSQPTQSKYGKGKSRSLYHFDKPLCATPVSDKQKLRYSLVTSSKNSRDSVIPLSEKFNKITAKDNKTSTPLLANPFERLNQRAEKSKSDIGVAQSSVCDKNLKDKAKSGERNDFEFVNNDELLINDQQVETDVRKSRSKPIQTQLNSYLPDPKTAKLPDKKTKSKKGKGKGNKSQLMEETSTRTLRRRQADENKTIDQQITMVRSTSAEDITYNNSPKRQDNAKLNSSTTMSSSKKAFFFETRTTVTNSYRNSTFNRDNPSKVDDPYSFDDFGELQIVSKPKTVKPPAPNKFFKSKNKQNTTVISSKSDSCIPKTTQYNSKKLSNEHPIWQQQREITKPVADFSDEEEEIIKKKSTINESKKLEKNKSKLTNSVQSSKSLPNIAQSASERNSMHASRRAKNVKTYFVPSEDDEEEEEDEIIKAVKSTKPKSKSTPSVTPSWKQATLDKMKSTPSVTPSWKQATLDKINQKIRDSNQFNIFNRESWGTGKPNEETPKFDLEISKYPLCTPAPEKERKKSHDNEKPKKQGSSKDVIETFTAICTGLILDSKEKSAKFEDDSEDKPKRTKSCDSAINRKMLDNSERKSVGGRSEVSWLEKKSSGKRKKFKKTYKKDKDKTTRSVRQEKDSESSEINSDDAESDKEVNIQELIKSKDLYKGTPKLVPTPRGLTRFIRSPLDIRIGQTPCSSGLPSLCVVSEDGATAPNSIQMKKKKFLRQQMESDKDSDDIEDVSVPVSLAPSQVVSQVPSQAVSEEPISSQIVSLNTLMKMATPKHIKKILEGDDDDDNVDEDDDNNNYDEFDNNDDEIDNNDDYINENIEKINKVVKKSVKIVQKSPVKDSEPSPILVRGDEPPSLDDSEQSDDKSVEENISTAGLVSGPSSRVRPTKSSLKRKYSDIRESSEDEESDESSDDSNHNNSSFIPRKLFKSDKKVKQLKEQLKENSKKVVRPKPKKLSPVKPVRKSLPKSSSLRRVSTDVQSVSTEGSSGSELEIDDIREEELSLKTGVTAVVRTFGVDIQNQLKAKRKQLESISQEAVRNSQKMASKMWSKQKSKRNIVLEKYQEKILGELNILEKEIVMLKEEEDRTMNFFSQQMKLLKTYKDSQKKRVQNMSHHQEELIDELNHLESDCNQQQQHLRTVLKKDMTGLQQRLLKETQQHQLMNVRKCLQTLYL